MARPLTRLDRFCVDVNSPRILQKATEELFLACSQYASDVPIVVVATKTDNYLDIESAKFRRACKKAGQRLEEDACDEHAAAQLLARIETIRTEMQSVEGGRLDACLAVSQGTQQQTSVTVVSTDVPRRPQLYCSAEYDHFELL